MAAPNLTLRSAAFVAKWGTNDAGYNAVGAPMAFLTIAAALADLAANYPAASATAPHVVSIEPGTYTTAAFALPAFTFIVGNPDGMTDPTSAVIVSLSGNVTMATGWNVNQTAFGGFLNITFRQTTAQSVDLTMPAPLAGNPARTVTLRNVRSDTDVFSWEATSTADVLNVFNCVHDGNSGDAVEFSAGTVLVSGLVSAAPVTFNDTAAIALSAQVYGLMISAAPSATAPGVTFASNLQNVTARMGGCDIRALTMNEAGAGTLTVYADAISIPLVANITFSGTAVDADLVRTTDSGAIAPGTGTFIYIVRTGARSVAAWGVNGVAINDTANTFTDTTSAGVVATAVTRSFGIPTFAASGVTTYTNAGNVYIAGPPAAGTNVTLTRAWSLWVATGDVWVTTGGTYYGAVTPGSITGAAGAITITSAGTDQNVTAITSGVGVLATVSSGAVPGGFALVRTTATTNTAIFAGEITAFNSSANRITIITSMPDTADATSGRLAFWTKTTAGGITQNLTLAGTGNLLVKGLTTDGTGAIQIAAGTTTANALTFGADTFVFRNFANQLTLNDASGNAIFNYDSAVAATVATVFKHAGTEVGRIGFAASGTDLLLATGANVTALTITATQIATFAAAVGAVGACTILNATAIPAGGTAGSGYKFSSTANFGVFFGSGAPSLVAAKGSLYLRSDGGAANDRAFIATDAAGTWTAVLTVA